MVSSLNCTFGVVNATIDVSEVSTFQGLKTRLEPKKNFSNYKAVYLLFVVYNAKKVHGRTVRKLVKIISKLSALQEIYFQGDGDCESLPKVLEALAQANRKTQLKSCFIEKNIVKNISYAKLFALSNLLSKTNKIRALKMYSGTTLEDEKHSFITGVKLARDFFPEALRHVEAFQPLNFNLSCFQKRRSQVNFSSLITLKLISYSGAYSSRNLVLDFQALMELTGVVKNISLNVKSLFVLSPSDLASLYQFTKLYSSTAKFKSLNVMIQARSNCFVSVVSLLFYTLYLANKGKSKQKIYLNVDRNEIPDVDESLTLQKVAVTRIANMKRLAEKWNVNYIDSRTISLAKG
eukprot:snap_masked-scaffold_38-processed-gene-1.23-mRNA-1 protein AED:1.00 eAED:1.00 QI:0/-1/0/0/-1/1/1/0/348